MPIVCAAVEFPEGINIIGMMEDVTADQVKIGMDVRSDRRRLYTNKNGRRASSPGSSRQGRDQC